jgi:hypothetical protein
MTSRVGEAVVRALRSRSKGLRNSAEPWETQFMPRRIIERIREKIRQGEYDMTAHATEEMAEDNLDILDVEQAIFNGQVSRAEKKDLRGTKYVVEGKAMDQQTPVGVVGRFTSTGRYLIVTVYEVTT